MKLTEEAKAHVIYKQWSTQLTGVAIVILVIILEAPQVLYNSWFILPDPIRQMLPQEWLQYLAVAVLVASIIAKFIPQKKLAEWRKQVGYESEPEKTSDTDS